MSLQNINLIDYESTSAVNKADEQYLIQALANLGQRLGVKGDSVTSGSFSFLDIFTDYKYYSPSKYIGVVERLNGNMFYYIANLSTMQSVENTKNSIENFYDTVFFTKSETVTTEITGIDQYKKNSFISTIKDNKYVICGIGQYKDESDEYQDKEFIYEEFDKNSNNLVNALRITEFGEFVLAISLSVTESNTATLSVTNLGAPLENILGKIETYIRSSLNSESTSTYDSITESKINSLSISSWFEIIGITRKSTNTDSITISYPWGSELPNDLFNNLEVSEQEKVKILMSKYGDISTLASYFSYDKTEILDVFKEYYSNTLYSSTSESFRQQILVGLFNGIYTNNPTSAKIYIPVNYVFNYYCNSNDTWQIYGGVQDLPIKFVNESITYKNIASYYSDNYILANVVGSDQTALYNYYVEYDDDSVYGIKFFKKYTFPYINTDDIWVVNNESTGVYAKGKDAGNPNIVVIYNYRKNKESNILGTDFDILSGANLSSLKTIPWKVKTAFVEPIEQINIEDPYITSKSDLLNVYCRVPYLDGTISDEEAKYLMNLIRYSLIINVSSVQCLDKLTEETFEKYGSYGVVTTAWSYNEEKNEFQVITNPNYTGNVSNVALDIVGLTNLNNLVKWHIEHVELKHPDKYTHSWVVFDNAKETTKNNTDDYQSYIYPTLMNMTASDLNRVNYNNDFNFFLKYNDMVTGAEESNITNVSTSLSKYLTEFPIPVTASLYRNNVNNSSIYWSEYMPNKDLPLFDFSEVLTANQNVLNRLNIISLNDKGNAFYSYIGSRYDSEDKNTITFGSSKTNINLGSSTMVNNLNRSIFERNDRLSVEFDNIVLQGNSRVAENLTVDNNSITRGIDWNVKTTNLRTVYSTTIIPTSGMLTNSSTNEPIMFNANNYKYDQFADKVLDYRTDGAIKRYYNNINVITQNNNLNMWIPTFYNFNNTSIYYLGEALYLPSLLKLLGLDEWINKSGLILLYTDSNVIYWNGYPLMIMTSNRFIESGEIKYDNNNSNPKISFVNIFDQVFAGYSLEISYYMRGSFLNLTIHENSPLNKVVNLFKINSYYPEKN
jgi:hypothetical protein